MSEVYHLQQLPLFPEKQCKKCLVTFPNTNQFFYSRNNRLDATCKECRKASVNRYPTLVTLTCETCGKEFTRGKAHQAYQVKKYNRQHIYCSNACNTIRAKEWPESIGEEYLQGASMSDLARKYGFTPRGVQVHLREMGIETGFTEAVRKRMSEKGIQRYIDHPEAREQCRQNCFKRMANGELRLSSKLEDRVAQELSRQGVVFTRQHFISIPGKQGFFACVDFLLLDGTVIEVNGTYWHTDPRKYPNGPINNTQREHIESDRIKRETFAQLGIPLIEIWEMDIEADMAGTISKALNL